MVDFPSSPTTGAVFTANRTQWRWDSAKWIPVGVDLLPYFPLSGGTITGDLDSATTVFGGGNRWAETDLTINGTIGCIEGTPNPALSAALTGASSSSHGGGFYTGEITTNSITCRRDVTTGNFMSFTYGAAGTVVGTIRTTNGTTVVYNTTSDIRLKTNIKQLSPEFAGHVIDALQPLQFRWRGHESEPKESGFAAQEVETHFPQAVAVGDGEPGDENFSPWNMDAAKLVPIMVAEIKALRARVHELESKHG